PFDLARKEQERGETYLQFGKLRTVQWKLRRETGHRFDRVPFPEATRGALRAVLADARAAGPDQDGWFSVTLADGGSMRRCWRRLDDDPDLDGGTAVIGRLSADVGRLLYRLLSEAELMLLPQAIATSKREAETVAAPWPKVRIVASASELHD